jgi:hypothetical protein
MESSPASYVNFPVHETIDIKDTSDIRNAVDRMGRLMYILVNMEILVIGFCFQKGKN